MNLIIEWIQRFANIGLITWFTIVSLSHLYPGKTELRLTCYSMLGALINAVVIYWRN